MFTIRIQEVIVDKFEDYTNGIVLFEEGIPKTDFRIDFHINTHGEWTLFETGLEFEDGECIEIIFGEEIIQEIQDYLIDNGYLKEVGGDVR